MLLVKVICKNSGSYLVSLPSNESIKVKTFNDFQKVQANMGYCPQFDALIDQMTGRETLTMYARLRGVPENEIRIVVNHLLDILMLKPHADKMAKDYR